MQSDKEECRACIGFDEKHTCEDWSKFQIMKAKKDRCSNCTRLQTRVDALENIVKVSGGLKCPNCNDEGFTPEQDGYGNWYQEQCEFCYTVPDSIFLRKEAIKALEGEGK